MQSLRARVAQRDGGKCLHCPPERPAWPYEKWEVDHVIPRVLGGSDDMSNLVTLCLFHHKEKTRTDGSKPRKQRVQVRSPLDRIRPGALTSSQPIGMIKPMADVWLSNAELGARLGLSPSGASYLRNGRRMPGAAVLKALVDVFDTPYTAFNDAIIEYRRGDRMPWVALMEELAGVAPPLSGGSEALRVGCPYCMAPPGERCTTVSRKFLAYGHEHVGRWELTGQRAVVPA